MSEEVEKSAVKVAVQVSLSLSLEEVNLLLAGLGELPAKVSIGLIEKVRMQATKQLNDQQ